MFTPSLLTDEPTMELVLKAKAGDREAVEALLERTLPALKRWAHGRLPAGARASLDTGDLVQDTAIRVLKRLAYFEPRHVGAMQAYLRQAVLNRIRDEVRQIGRRPAKVELPQDLDSADTSPLEQAIAAQSYERYRTALRSLDPRDRELVVARLEMEMDYAQMAEKLRMPSPDAARMAATRAIKRLSAIAQSPAVA